MAAWTFSAELLDHRVSRLPQTRMKGAQKAVKIAIDAYIFVPNLGLQDIRSNHAFVIVNGLGGQIS